MSDWTWFEQLALVYLLGAGGLLLLLTVFESHRKATHQFGKWAYLVPQLIWFALWGAVVLGRWVGDGK